MKKMKKTKHLVSIIAILLLFTEVLASFCTVPVYAALSLPDITWQSYAEAKAPCNISVYRDTSFSARGTISPAKTYAARIDKNDTIKIESVLGSVSIVSYPTPSGWRKGAIHTSEILLRPSPIEGGHSKGRATVYATDSSATAYGTIFVNDVVYSYGTRNNRTQILYQALSGNRAYKIGWIPTSIFNSKVKGKPTSISTQTVSQNQSLSKDNVIINTSYNVSVSNKASENKPHYTNRAGNRGANAYNRIIDQFKVSSNNRYKRAGSKTYCNIYAWDVMSAMNVNLPHWITSDGSPATSRTRNAFELTANAVYNWLFDHGSRYGWRKVSAENAQARANLGYPTIAIWKNPDKGSGHVAVIRPETKDYKHSKNNPIISQAGAKNYNITYASKGFGKDKLSSIVYWTHD